MLRENRALAREGGGKRTVRGGGPKPLFGRAVICEVFHHFNGFPPGSRRLSIRFDRDFLSISITFNQFQSILIHRVLQGVAFTGVQVLR